MTCGIFKAQVKVTVLLYYYETIFLEIPFNKCPIHMAVIWHNDQGFIIMFLHFNFRGIAQEDFIQWQWTSVSVLSVNLFVSFFIQGNNELFVRKYELCKVKVSGIFNMSFLELYYKTSDTLMLWQELKYYVWLSSERVVCYVSNLITALTQKPHYSSALINVNF